MNIADAFVKSSFARFVNTPAGRLARFAGGGALVAWGYLHRDSAVGLALLVFGLLPAATAAFDLCFMGAIIGGPIRGSAYRPKASAD